MHVRNGIAVVRADDPQYGRMKGLAVLGKADFIGERYDEDGVLTAAFRNPQSYASNPEITIGGDFFMSALRDYRDWKEKWWREAIQNAVDANSTSIECGSLRNEDGTWTVWCADDGVGMDAETILTKFLVLGASGKREGGSSVGGFGKAKELLILPWIGWEVHSKNTLVVGQGTKYEVDSAKGRRGTKITVTMAADMYTHGLQAGNYIKKCYLPNIDFYVHMTNVASGKEERVKVWADLAVGRKIDDLTTKDGVSVGGVYYDANKKALVDQRLLVRSKGLCMFDKWMPPEVTGTIIAELTGKTIDLLTANRDEFRDYRVGNQIESFSGRVAKDITSALQEKQGILRKKFKGTGRKLDQRMREFEALLKKKLLGSPEAIETAETGQPVVLDPVNVIDRDAYRTYVPSAPERDVPEEKEESPQGFFLNFTVPDGAIEAMTSIKMDGPNQIECAAAQLAWQPDFFVMNNIPGYVPPKTFFPDHMSARHLKLIRLWCEFCRFILIQLNCGTPFGIGINFDPSSRGTHLEDDDGHWLFFNPFRTKKGHKTAPSDDPFLDYAVKEDVYHLYATAVHECTHMADGVHYHDEAFSSALTYNFAKTSGRDRQIVQILKSIKGGRILTPEQMERQKDPTVVFNRRFKQKIREFMERGLGPDEAHERAFRYVTEKYGPPPETKF